MDQSQFQVAMEDVEAAKSRLEGIIRITPMLSSNIDPELHFKSENLQITGSFKIRAAYNQIAQLSKEERKRGIITSSSGNFAQGTAYASRLLGVSAKIVMMKSSNPVKVERTRAWGGEVVFCDDRFEAREETVQKIQQSEGRTLIHPYNHPAVVAGNATIGLEILEQCPAVENVVVPISGGGLISGIALAVSAHKPSVKIWGVQPEGSNATYLSFRSKKIMSIERAETLADGLKVTRPGDYTFPFIQKWVHDVVLVSEASILSAIDHFLREEKLVVEPSGAVTLAAVFQKKVPLKKTVLVLSGGNIEASLLRRALGD